MDRLGTFQELRSRRVSILLYCELPVVKMLSIAIKSNQHPMNSADLPNPLQR
jgi:hypothetical protein